MWSARKHFPLGLSISQLLEGGISPHLSLHIVLHPSLKVCVTPSTSPVLFSIMQMTNKRGGVVTKATDMETSGFRPPNSHFGLSLWLQDWHRLSVLIIVFISRHDCLSLSAMPGITSRNYFCSVQTSLSTWTRRGFMSLSQVTQKHCEIFKILLNEMLDISVNTLTCFPDESLMGRLMTLLILLVKQLIFSF